MIPDYKMMDPLWEVRKNIPLHELLAGLAEEAAELAQAALKLRRVIDGTNPTPVDYNTAQGKVLEETADVLLYLGALRLIDAVDVSPGDGEKIQSYLCEKRNRWLARLREKEADSQK